MTLPDKFLLMGNCEKNHKLIIIYGMDAIIKHHSRISKNLVEGYDDRLLKYVVSGGGRHSKTPIFLENMYND